MLEFLHMGASNSRNDGKERLHSGSIHSIHGLDIEELSYSLSISSSSMEDMVLCAAICSHAVYSQTSTDIEDCMREWSHFGPRTEKVISSFQRILLSQNSNGSKHRFMAAHTHETVYIAFQGQKEEVSLPMNTMKSFDDEFSTSDIAAAMCTELLDHVPLACLAQGVDNRRIVFCGHSMGGAIAHAVQLQYLRAVFPMKHSDWTIPHSMLSIAFGAPHFANEKLARWLMEQGLNRRFITVVNRQDPVPAYLEKIKVSPEFNLRNANTKDALHSSLFSKVAPYFYMCEARDEATIQKFYKSATKVHQKLENVCAKSKSNTESFFVPSGVFVHLNSSIAVMDNLMPQSLPSDITVDSLKQHMLLGPEGYASQLLVHLTPPSNWNLRSLSGDFPLVMQPAPVIESAFFEGNLEKGVATMTISGRNLFFLSKSPTIYRDCAHSKMNELVSDCWKVVSYSNSGTSLKFVLDGANEKWTGIRCCHSELRVEITTAFGSDSQKVSSLTRDLMSALDMWKQCVEVLALIVKHVAINPNQKAKVENALMNLLSLTRLQDSRPADFLSDISKLVSYNYNDFFNLLQPFLDAVGYHLGCVWDFQMKEPAVERLPVGSGVSVLSGGDVVAVTDGIGAISVHTVGESLQKKHRNMNAMLKISNYTQCHILKHVSRSEILNLLLSFVQPQGDDFLNNRLVSLSDAEKEAEIVQSAIDLEIACNMGEDLGEDSIYIGTEWMLGINPHSFIILNGCEAAIQESVSKILIVAQVYRLYSVLKLHEHTYVAVLGNENSGKTTLVDLAGRRYKRSFPVNKVPRGEIGSDVHTWDVRAYQVQDDLWFVDFPGLNSMDVVYRTHAELLMQRFRNVCHSVVVVITFSNHRTLSDRLVIEQARKTIPVDGKLLVIANGVDRYKHRIASSGISYLDQAKVMYCDDLKLSHDEICFSVLKYDLNLKEQDAYLMASLPKLGVLEPLEVVEKINRFISLRENQA